MIAYFLFVFTGLTWLLATVSAPDSAPTAPANPKVSIYEITSPVPYQVVTDQVDIIGSVNSPDMTRYFVEYYRVLDDGAHWLPATLPRIEPVIDDRLGNFHTTFLPDGEYDMRLVVLTGGDTTSTLTFGPIVVRNSPMAAATKAAEVARRAARQATAEYCEPPADANKMDRASEISVSIDAPLPNQIVSGSVEFIGTVSAPEPLGYFFESRRVSAVQQDKWHLATLWAGQAVESDRVETWHTQGISDGDYMLRLTVIACKVPAQHFLFGPFKVRNSR